MMLARDRRTRSPRLSRDELQPSLSSLSRASTHLQSPHPVDHGDYSIEPDVCVPLLVPPEGFGDRSRISEPCRLENDVVERSSLSDHFLDGSEAVVTRGTAQASVGEGEEGSGGSTGGILDRDGSS